VHQGFLLSNIRVIEMGDGMVGPVAGLLLADLGAEVIKVESITRMDMARGPSTPPKGGSFFYASFPDGVLGERYWNRNGAFVQCNLGKFGVTLDLTKPKGLEAFMRLVNVSDVFLSNMAVGVDEKLGVTYEALVKVNPKIIYLSATGYGRTGPYARRVAMGNCIDAACGFSYLRDYGDGDSTALTPDTQCDAIAAVNAAFAILVALYHRKMTGTGVFIDASMVEPSMAYIGEAIMDYTMNHRIQRSLGNRDMSMTQGCYRCKGEDEWVTLSISSDEEWQRFTKVMGSPALATDERFSDVLGRLKNQDELDRLIGAWTATHTKYEVMNLLQQVDIAAGAVLNSADVYGDYHIKERGFLQSIEQPEVGVRTYVGRLWKLEETEMPKRSHAPRLGEHNEYVLKEIAGLTSDEILELERECVIGTTPMTA